MISLVLTKESVTATLHTRGTGKPLFTIPLALEDGGYVGVAKRVKKEIKANKAKARKVEITLMENVVFKEFSHQPVSLKLLQSFAKLEARTTLGEQIESFAVSCMPYGAFRNEQGEANSLLLATPITLLKGIQSAFQSEGMHVVKIHSGFDAFTAVCDKLLPYIMDGKSCAAIDFDNGYTLINIYANGVLASQRRLQGLTDTILPPLCASLNLSKDAVIDLLANRKYTDDESTKITAALTDFVWDVLRTVRVVCAPMHIDMEGFFVSGDVCRDKLFCNTIKDNMGSSCVFADELITEKMAGFAKPVTGYFVNIGTQLSKLDLLLPVKSRKKIAAIDIGICAILSVIVAAGMIWQPVSLAISAQKLNEEKAKLEAMTPISEAMEKTVEANNKLKSIAEKQEVLKTYKSNVGDTLPDVMALFGEGLTPKTISYNGDIGLYSIIFTAVDEAHFLTFKDEMYKNSKYYLNLSLTSDVDTEGTLSCTLGFTPQSFVPLPPPVEAKAEPQDNEIMAETIMKDLGASSSGSK
ncbi:MAG: hypothetical protein RR424_03305 [Oscillospiraceae bacterium]